MKDLPDVDVDLNNSRLTITYLGYDNVSKGSQEKSSQVPSDVLVSQNAGSQVLTECPKIYRKSVLHLLKYRFAVYLSIAVQICGKFSDTQYFMAVSM